MVYWPWSMAVAWDGNAGSDLIFSMLLAAIIKNLK
jgi:hypothetical protein